MASRSPIEIARELDAAGLNVFPARYKGKATVVEWKSWQDKRTTDRLPVWFGGGAKNFWVLTGWTSGVVVLDVDNKRAEAYWRDEMGLAEAMDATACVLTSEKEPGWRGRHYYFTVQPNDRIASWSVHPTDDNPDAPSFDVRAERNGVIVPPSVHESGLNYEWFRPLAEAVPLPDALRAAGRAGRGAGRSATGTSTGGAPGAAGGGTASGRSMLAHLLENPGNGGWNNWLNKVSGHYAKQFRNHRDAYEAHCAMAFGLLRGDDPMTEADYEKTIESSWRMEHENHQERQVDDSSGWLMPGDYCLMTQVVKSKGAEGKATEYDLAEWADFDIRATGVVEADDASRVYDVEVLRKRDRVSRQSLLPGSVLADQRKLTAWLAEFGVTVVPPENMWPRQGTINARLTRYIESQNPPRFSVVDSLGWDGTAGGFVAHEGIIRGDGLHGFQGLRPHPRLKGWAPYSYGMRDEADARAVLREVLTFHDETVTAVFGSWWAACFLKPQFHEVASQFPFMAAQAPSESGKTTGFFPLMLALNGNTQGQVSPTKAALRDAMSANQSGIVWIDDMDDPEFLFELLRQATGEGSVAKKSEDRMGQQVVRLVAPICISGEALGLDGQKALLDRAVNLSVPSPVGRRSQHDPSRPQWDDIVALRKQYPEHEGGLTVLSGSMVSLALRHEELAVDAFRELRSNRAGRWGDKIAIVRAGARLLGAMTGDEDVAAGIAARVDAWAGVQADQGSENALTMKLLPAALSAYSWPSRPEPSDGPFGVLTPAFVQGTDLWFSPVALAEWWSRRNNGRVKIRTESADALAEQARAIGLGGAMGTARKQFRLGSGTHKSVYWKVSGELARAVLERSTQGSSQDSRDGATGYPVTEQLPPVS